VCACAVVRVACTVGDLEGIGGEGVVGGELEGRLPLHGGQRELGVLGQARLFDLLDSDRPQRRLLPAFLLDPPRTEPNVRCSVSS